MAPISNNSEISTIIPPSKLFQALVLDGDKLIPKILPQAIKSIQILQGDGGAGTIKLLTFGEGSQFKSVKHRVDRIDKENCTYSYTIIEGDALMDKVESISYTVKIEASADGGSICKSSSTYHTKGDAQITEEQIKDGKQKALGLFKALEAYLLANPDV